MSYELIAAKREALGTGASRRLRRAGQLPAVVYGGEKGAESIVLEHKAVFYAAKEEAFHSSVIDLLIDGKKEQVLVRDYQMHPFKQQVQHIDFQRIDASQKIHVKVQLHFVNVEANQAVKLQGSKISHVITEVDVRALPADLPKFIEVDLADLTAGHSLHLSDLIVAEGVEIVALTRGDNSTVVSASGKAQAEAAAE